VDRLAQSNGLAVTRGQFLGALMAHEIGHVLIGSGIHSAAGIMKAHWGSRDLPLIRQGRPFSLPTLFRSGHGWIGVNDVRVMLLRKIHSA
jgi:hypothetical protein